ncbi:hypothetical protein BN946_scf184989.g53 [Trametes cinnabarina]|uniref:Uncharacterized protein n=1 Tax=Pycnoporus cinnabarinus TaxID=5643 RepID=A0A060S348_PYCCI|nr:hypothetical protein BN946_scf184989.g53 [Trametes cinnabarina]
MCIFATLVKFSFNYMGHDRILEGAHMLDSQTNPAPRSFIDLSTGETRPVSYQGGLKGHEHVSFATTSADQCAYLAVKFTARYSIEAHQVLAPLGIASPLLYCGPPIYARDYEGYTGRKMVVTKLIVGDHQHPYEQYPPIWVCAKGHEAVEALHARDYVHEDLRYQNVILWNSNSTFALIDFDWAGKVGKVGKVGKARYPKDLSRDLGATGRRAEWDHHEGARRVLAEQVVSFGTALGRR